MWLICSNRKLYHKKNDLFAAVTLHSNNPVIDSLNIFTAQIVHSHMYSGNINSLADQNVGYTVYKKCSQQIITQKATRTVLLD